MKKNFLLILICIIALASKAQTSNLVFMVPAGERYEGSEVFKKMERTDPDYLKAYNQLMRGFMAESFFLYDLVQNYLVHQGKISKKEPLYIAFTDNEIYQARKGFLLRMEDGISKKDGIYYIDFNRDILDDNPAKAGSYTQVVPEEVGRIILSQLSGTVNQIVPKEHYFCTQTDRATAFYEGFAQHFRFVAVQSEPDERIKRTIQEDLRKIGLWLPKYLHGFRRDYNLKGRFGVFRATAPVWFSKLETMRKHTFIESRLIQHLPQLSRNDDPWLQILYKDASVWPDITKYRTMNNAVATEGVISTFFAYLIASDAKKNYYPTSYYRDFLPDDTAFIFERQIFPLRNEYLKIFTVLAKYVRMDVDSRAQIIDFIEGYAKEFPHEAELVKGVWSAASGVDYQPVLPEPLWVVINNAHFIPSVLSQFGPKLKTYPFDMNNCDSVELVAVKGVTPTDAIKLLEYRNKNGGFQSLNQIASLTTISPSAREGIEQLHPFEKEKIRPENSSQNWSYTYTLWAFLKMAFLYFIGIGLIYFALAQFLHYHPKLLQYLWNFLQFFLLSLLGIVCTAITTRNIMLFMGFVLVILALEYVFRRKQGMACWFEMGTTFFMSLLLVYSLY